MTTQDQKKLPILFFQGGGEDGYEADRKMVESLRSALGNSFEVRYPELKSDETKSDFGWLKQIEEQITNGGEQLIVVGHSLGASLMLKFLSEKKFPGNVIAVFLLATPFWRGSEDWKQGLILHEHFAAQLPADVPIHFYQSADDEEVPLEHFETFRQKVGQAQFHRLKKGGHQFENDLSFLANAIQKLVSTKIG